MVAKENVNFVGVEHDNNIELSQDKKTNELESNGHDLREELLAVWPKVLESIMESCKDSSNDMSDALAWLNRLLKENVPFGKLARGCAAISFYRELRPKRTAEEDYESYIAAYLIEMLQTASLIIDDIMDGSTLRRGSPSWYMQNDVGLLAINDGFMLENLVYKVLAYYFGQKSYYGSLLKLLQDISFKTIMGQHMDTKMAHSKNYERFNLKLYRNIVKLKTSYYTFYAPIASAMIMAGIEDPTQFEAMESILLDIGEYFQIQDDYLDCYGNPEVTGKIGTDIVDGKCSWLFVKAMQIATNETKANLLKNYGQNSSENEETVKEIYQSLQIAELYDEFEFKSFFSITKKIGKLPDNLPKSPIRQLLNAMYQRKR